MAEVFIRNHEWGTAYTPPHGDAILHRWGGETRELLPLGFDALQFGTTTIAKPQQISPSGWDSLRFGSVAFVYDREISPSSWSSFFAGTPTLREVFIRNHEWGTAYTPPHGDAILHQWGGEPGELLPLGFDALQFGTTTIANLQQFVFPNGIYQFGAGDQHTVVTTPEIRPIGIQPPSPQFGGHMIGDAKRELQLTGFTQQAFGTAFVANYDQSIDLAGRSITGAVGTPLVDYAVRFLYPQWFAHYGVGTPMVGYHQTLEPEGFDASLFGTHEVHDNTQRVLGTSLGVVTEWGAPDVSRSPRTIEPQGFVTGADAFPSGRWGQHTEVYNLTQIVKQIYAPDPTQDGGVFGDPIWMSIENVNRKVTTLGHRDSMFSRLATIENAAVPVLPTGIDGIRWGQTLVADAIRHVYPETWESFYCGPYGNEIANAARVIRPGGFDGMAFGTPAWSNPPQDIRFSMWHDGAYGTPFVSHSPRTITTPLGPECLYGIPDIQLLTRYVEPQGFTRTSQFGGPFLEERFTIFYPKMWESLRMGEPTVLNLTPEVRTFGHKDTEWGLAGVHLYTRYVAHEGPDTSIIPKPQVEHRTKVIGVPGFVALKTSPFTEVRKVTPDPPPEQRIYPEGRAWTIYGTPVVSRNVLEPQGDVHTRFGQETEVRLLGAIVSGIEPPVPQFGSHTVKGPQYITITSQQSIKPPEERLPPEIGTPDFQPRTIWATFTVTQQAIANHGGTEWELMDDVLDVLDTGERPFFGTAAVTLGTRAIAPEGDDHSELGEPTLELENRTIFVEGIRSWRIGIPKVPHPQTIDFLLGTRMNGEVFGDHTVDLRDKEIAVPSLPMPGAGTDEGQYGVAEVDFFHRTRSPEGWDSLQMGLPAPEDKRESIGLRVHPPEPYIIGMGKQTLWGETWISNRIRYVEPHGWIGEDFRYTPGQFAERMRVRRRARVDAPTMGDTLAFGTAMVADADRAISVPSIADESVVTAPSLRKQNIIALASYGFQDTVFGDVQKWEAGKIKPQGEDYVAWGGARIDRSVAADGFDSLAFGTGVVWPHVVGHGWAELAFGDSVVSHGDGLEFTCGQLPRAIAVPGFEGLSFGTPVFEGWGYVEDGYYEEGYAP